MISHELLSLGEVLFMNISILCDLPQFQNLLLFSIYIVKLIKKIFYLRMRSSSTFSKSSIIPDNNINSKVYVIVNPITLILKKFSIACIWIAKYHNWILILKFSRRIFIFLKHLYSFFKFWVLFFSHLFFLSSLYTGHKICIYFILSIETL